MVGQMGIVIDQIILLKRKENERTGEENFLEDSILLEHANIHTWNKSDTEWTDTVLSRGILINTKVNTMDAQ